MSDESITWSPRPAHRSARGSKPQTGYRLPPINLHLAGLAVLSIVCALGLGAWLVIQHARAERAAIEQQAQTLARLSSFSIDREIVAARAMLTTLASSWARASHDAAALHASAVETPKPAGASVLLADPGGKQLFNTLRPFGAPLPAPLPDAQPFLRRIIESRAPTASDLLYSVLRQEYVVGLGIPIVENGTVASVLAVSIPIDNFLTILDEHQRPADWIAGIFDRSGNTIARSHAAQRYVGRPGTADLVARITEAESGTYVGRTHENVAVYVAFSRSRLSGWTAAVGVPLTVLDAPLRGALLAIGGGGSLLVVVGLSFALLLGRRIRSPVARHLEVAEDRFHVMTETVPAMLFISEADGTLEYANARFFEITGVRTTALGQLDWPALLHPADVDKVKAVRDANIPRGQPFECEFRLRGREGDYRWYMARSQPLCDAAGGTVRWCSAAVDIDGLKRTEEALRESNDERGAILASISECYFTVDRHQRIVEFNHHFAQWMKPVVADPAALIGRTMGEVFPAFRGMPVQTALDEALTTDSITEAVVPSALRPTTWLEFRVYPSAHGASVFFRDVSARKRAELAIKASQAVMQGTIDALSTEILLLDRERRIVAVNHAWSRYARETGIEGDGIGADYAALVASFVLDAQQAAQLAAGLALVLRGDAHTLRLEFDRSNGEMRRFQLRISRFGEADDLRLVVAHEDVTEIHQSASALQQITDCLLQAQESERRRIARELHDSTAQNLAAATMIIDRLTGRQVAAGDPRTAATLAELRGLIMQAMAEIRNFSYLLHPPLLDTAGLASALKTYAHGFAERSGIAVAVEVSSDIARAPAEVERGLFRVAQEALANIRRHSGSGTARLSLRRDGTRLVLRIEDEGRGMDITPVSEERQGLRSLGVGIVGMRARLRQLGGKLEIQSSARGTTVIATVPIRADTVSASSPRRAAAGP